MRYLLIALSFLSVALGCNVKGEKLTKSKLSPEKYAPAEITEWFLSTGDWDTGTRLYVRTIGTGPDTAIMLHGGWGAEHRYLTESTLGLEDKYCFVFYDQRGSLRSPFPDSLISFEHHIQDLELIRKELKLDKLKLVGHSMGAVLACAYREKFPDHVKSLILLAPAYLKKPVSDNDIKLVDQSEREVELFSKRKEVQDELDKLRLLRTDSPLSSKEKTYKFRISFAGSYLFHIEKWRFMKGGGPFFNPKTRKLTLASSPSRWDYLHGFKESGIPISIILGDHDCLDMQARIIKEWTSGIPNVGLTVIKEAGHELWLDQPEAFRSHLDYALKK